VDANIKGLKGADLASEKKFRSGLNKQIAQTRRKATLLSKKTTKASLAELKKINQSQAKFNAS